MPGDLAGTAGSHLLPVATPQSRAGRSARVSAFCCQSPALRYNYREHWRYINSGRWKILRPARTWCVNMFLGGAVWIFHTETQSKWLDKALILAAGMAAACQRGCHGDGAQSAQPSPPSLPPCLSVSHSLYLVSLNFCSQSFCLVPLGSRTRRRHFDVGGRFSSIVPFLRVQEQRWHHAMPGRRFP